MTRVPADGTHGQADRYLGDCAGCPARVGFGDGWVMRAGKRYHTGCDPTPDAVTCQPCGVEIDTVAAGSRFPVCADCIPLRHVALWCVKGLQDAFAPEADTVPRGLAPDKSTAVRFGPRGAAEVRAERRRELWREMG